MTWLIPLKRFVICFYILTNSCSEGVIHQWIKCVFVVDTEADCCKTPTIPGASAAVAFMAPLYGL